MKRKKSVKSVKKSMLFVEIMWKIPCVKNTDLHFSPYAYIFFHHSSLSTTCHGFLFLSISNPITEAMLWFIKEHASELFLSLEVVPEYKIGYNAETRADETLEFSTWRGYHALFGKSAPVLATNSDSNWKSSCKSSWRFSFFIYDR